MACSRCGSGAQDASGFCRRCGTDVRFPSHPPTDAELQDAERGRVNPPTYAPTTRKRRYLEKRGGIGRD